MKDLKKGSILFALFLLGHALFSQSSEQKVREAVNKINQMVEEVHQLANQRKIDAAFQKLNQINHTFSTETTWGTFNEEYRNAKLQNPSFDYQLRTDLPANLDAAFWVDYQKRCDRIMADQEQALDGFKSMVQLNKWDQVMAYGAQIKNSYETIKNAIENLGSGNIPKFAYDLYGNMNDFIDNYTKIQDAEIAGVDIQTQKMEFQNMMRKAEINKELYRDFESSIRVNIDMIYTFQSNIKYIDDRKTDASSGPLKPLQPTLDYLWNYGFFEKTIKEACDEMEHYEVKCAKLKEEVDATINDARRDWRRVDVNIKTSDDEANKARYFADNKALWDEFESSAKAIYNEAYQLYCQDNSAGSENSNNSTNPFDGASASGTTVKPNNDDPAPNNGDQSNDTENEGSAWSTESNNDAASSLQPPPNSKLIGTVYKRGGGGQYKAIALTELRTNDRIVFLPVSGQLEYVQLIWRKEGGIWETAYEGPKTEFMVGDFIEDRPARTTHLNFVVNSHHNHFSTRNADCEMEVYLVRGGGSSIPSSNSGSGASAEVKPQPGVQPQPNQNPQPRVQPNPQSSTPVNTNNKEFTELLKKAQESFNKNYWEEEQGTRASSNPKQESLNYLVQASRLINREADPKTKYDMVLSLCNMSTRFAQRVFAYENKIPFINLAGETANRAGSQVSGIQNPDAAKKQELQKYAYSRTASAWKCVRDAALIQGGNYTPESCDREYLKYKSLSER